jgi:hypothetical protein
MKHLFVFIVLFLLCIAASHDAPLAVAELILELTLAEGSAMQQLSYVH